MAPRRRYQLLAIKNSTAIFPTACHKPTLFARVPRGIESQSINPGTAVPKWLYACLHDLDVIIVMSVNPGFAGQKFMPEVLPKMVAVNKELREHGFKGYVEADGGIKAENIDVVVKAGAEVIVSGSGIFKTTDYGDTIRRMRQAVGQA